MNQNPISFAFFGTGPLAESVLASLIRGGFTPKLLVTKEDAPQGRHMEIQPPNIKVWAQMKGINVFQPATLKNLEENSPLHTEHFDLFIVASYGKIIPSELLSIPKHGTLNVHPSMLPLYRGASPIESVLLDGATASGVSIMQLDDEVDHGPILVQNGFTIDDLATAGTLEVTCGQIGGELLTHVLSDYISGTLVPKDQDHDKATFCKKIEKSFGEIKLTDSIDEVRRKFRAFTPWPGIYFFTPHDNKQMRVKITKVDLVTPHIETTPLESIILSVIPEGKKEMDWESFKRGYIQ